MIESEGITENVKSWRTDVVSAIMKELPPDRVMFEGEYIYQYPITTLSNTSGSRGSGRVQLVYT